MSVAVAAVAIWAAVPRTQRPVRFREVTFRRGQVPAARFTPDGRGVVYSARWDDGPARLYLAGDGSPESRPLGFDDLQLAAVARGGELALLSFGGTMNIAGGTLYRVPMTGSAPSYVDRGIMAADWLADGSGFYVARLVQGRSRLEGPSGTAVYETAGWLSHVRAAPRGSAVAFIDHPVRHDDAGRLMLHDPAGGTRPLTGRWAAVLGLAWNAAGSEVWFTATPGDGPRSVWAVSLQGTVRPVAQAPGSLTLRDIAADGRVLVSRDTRRLEMAGRLQGDAAERDLSWLDWSRVQEVGPGGRTLLFDESGEAAGAKPVVYLRDTGDGATRRLGEGFAMGLTPDGQAALLATADRLTLQLVPITGGPPRPLPRTGLRYQWARVFPDGQRWLALASRTGEGLRLYTGRLADAAVSPLGPEQMIRNVAISPDGGTIALLSGNNELVLQPVEGGEHARVLARGEPLAPLRFHPDGRSLYVQHLRRANESAAQVSRIDTATGRVTPWRVVQPADRMGLHSITGVALSPDSQWYVYSYRRILSELFLADGWR